MPPRTPDPKGYEHFLKILERPDIKSAYRLIIIFAVVGMTPLAPMLPTINGMRPLWERVTDLQYDIKNTGVKVDQLTDRIEKLETKTTQVDTKVTTLETRITGFEINLERFKDRSYKSNPQPTPSPNHD